MSYYGPDVARVLLAEQRRQAQWRTYGTGPPPSRDLTEVLLLASLGAQKSVTPRLDQRRRRLAAITKRMEDAA
jgi:hypothetical protein